MSESVRRDELTAANADMEAKQQLRDVFLYEVSEGILKILRRTHPRYYQVAYTTKYHFQHVFGSRPRSKGDKHKHIGLTSHSHRSKGDKYNSN